MEELRLPRARAEVLLRVLGVDAALDGVTGDLYLLLGEGQGQPGGHPQLFLHQVPSGDQLGHRVLHLDSGVHFNEIELPVRGQDEFHGPRPHIARRLGGGHGGLAHPLPQLRRQRPGGGFLDELLPAALHRAVPLPQMDHMALGIRHDLELNVPGVQHQLFQIHLSVAEAGHRLGLGGLIGAVQLLRPVHLPHPPAPASGGGLQQHGIAHLLGQRPGGGRVGHRAVRPGDHRHPGLLGHGPGGGLAAQLTDHVAGGADIPQPGLPAAVGEVRVFRQKAIARVDGVAIRYPGRRQQGVLIQIAVRRPGRTNADGPGGQLGGQRALVRRGVDRHGLDVQLPAGPDDPQGDLPPVGDQNTLQHGLTPSGCGTAGRGSPPPRRPGPGPPPPRSRRGRGSRSSSSWPR